MRVQNCNVSCIFASLPRHLCPSLADFGCRFV